VLCLNNKAKQSFAASFKKSKQILKMSFLVMVNPGKFKGDRTLVLIYSKY